MASSGGRLASSGVAEICFRTFDFHNRFDSGVVHRIHSPDNDESIDTLRIELTYRLSNFSFLRNFHVLLSK